MSGYPRVVYINQVGDDWWAPLMLPGALPTWLRGKDRVLSKWRATKKYNCSDFLEAATIVTPDYIRSWFSDMVIVWAPFQYLGGIWHGPKQVWWLQICLGLSFIYSGIHRVPCSPIAARKGISDDQCPEFGDGNIRFNGRRTIYIYRVFYKLFYRFLQYEPRHELTPKIYRSFQPFLFQLSVPVSPSALLRSRSGRQRKFKTTCHGFGSWVW